MMVALLRSTRHRVSGQRWGRAWLAPLYGLISCLSCAGIDDVKLFADDGPLMPGGSGGTSGGGGASSSPAPGVGNGGALQGGAPGPTPAGEAGTGIALGGSSSSPSPDASTKPSGAADAGPPSGDPSEPPPGPVEEPSCVGLALQLDGATFATIPRPVEDDFTFEAWIKTRESLPGTTAFYGRAIFDSDVIGMGNQNDFEVSVLNDGVAFGVGGPDTSAEGGTVVTADAWAHIAVTRQASTGELRVFLDGALEAVAVAPNRNSLSGRPDLAMGGFTASRRFIGSIDEVRIWNVVRSAAEISANMRTRSSGSEPGLVGYYTFEDGDTRTTDDASASGNAATLTGSPQFVASTALCAPGQAP